MWCDVRKDFALGEKQDGSQYRTHHVGDGTGSPDAGEPVHAHVGENHRDEVCQRQQEYELSGKAGRDGNPGLVDGLEEVGVDDGETDEREHHHQEAHGGFSNLDKFRIRGEDFHHAGWEEARYHTAEQTDEDANPHGEEIDVFKSVGEPRAIVVAGDGLHALADTEDEHHHEAAEGVHNAVSSYSQIAAVAQQLAIQHGYDKRSTHIHQEGTHANERDIFENITSGFPTVGFETDEGSGLYEMKNGHKSGNRHGDGGSPSGSRDA